MPRVRSAAALTLTGVVLTKTDGDARGGAALVGPAESPVSPFCSWAPARKPMRSNRFRPSASHRASSAWAMCSSLVENVTRNVDREQAEKLARKLKKGKDFDLEDLHDQLQQVERMGGLSAMMDKLPSQYGRQGGAMRRPMGNEKEIKRQVAIIRSMTPGERAYPRTIDASRKRRIAAGSGVHVSEINKLLKSYLQMQKVMKSMTKGGGMGRK